MESALLTMGGLESGWSVLQAILLELASVRIHGLSDREIRAAIDFNMSDAESLYIERDQVYAEVILSQK